MDDFVQIGLDDIERGDTYTQEEMEAWFAAKKANRVNSVAAE
jgi:predicted transcriptional regulator